MAMYHEQEMNPKAHLLLQHNLACSSLVPLAWLQRAHTGGCQDTTLHMRAVSLIPYSSSSRFQTASQAVRQWIQILALSFTSSESLGSVVKSFEPKFIHL